MLFACVAGDVIRRLCTRFYEYAFEDSVLAPFMFHTDSAKDHGKRLGDWIVEKMGGEGDVWSDSGRHGMRQPSHAAAWHSWRRPPQDRGKRFSLKDCRIWMRLMFLSARELRLDQHVGFFDW